MKAERKELLSSLMKLDEMISAKEKLIWEKEGQINLGYHLKEKSNLISRRKEIIERLKKENTIYIWSFS